MEVGMGEHKERTHLQTADASADPDRRRRGGGGALEALRRRQQRSAGGQSNGPIGGQTVKMVKMVKTVKHGRSNSLKSGSRQLVERAESVMSGSDWPNERERAVIGQTNQNGQTGRIGRIVRNGQRPAATGQTDRTNQTGPTGPYGQNLLAVPGPAPTRRPSPVVKNGQNLRSKPARRGRTCADA